MAYNLARRKIDDAASLMTVSLTEKLADLGYVWRIDTGYKALAANGDYASIHFHTPFTHRIFYTFAQVDKSGSELVISLVPGDSNPSSKPGGNARAQGIIILKRDVDYTIKMLAKGALTFAAHVAMGIYPIRNP